MIVKTIFVEYEIGQIVFLKTDCDQKPRICTGYLVDDTSVLYRLQCGTTYDYHYSMEIAVEKDVLITSTN